MSIYPVCKKCNFRPCQCEIFKAETRRRFIPVISDGLPVWMCKKCGFTYEHIRDNTQREITKQQQHACSPNEVI